jgi:hypothetical protein
MDQNQTQTWSVSRYGKAMYQISNEYEKKERKTNNSWFFSKSKGHNLVKNQWIRTKFKLDLYLGLAKQCTKYQMLIRKTVKFLKGHNSSKYWSIATIFELDLQVIDIISYMDSWQGIWTHNSCQSLYSLDRATSRGRIYTLTGNMSPYTLSRIHIMNMYYCRAINI